MGISKDCGGRVSLQHMADVEVVLLNPWRSSRPPFDHLGIADKIIFQHLLITVLVIIGSYFLREASAGLMAKFG